MKHRFINQIAEVKLKGADTGGEAAAVEIEGPAGPGAPLHVHRREDETIYVLDGDLTFYVGDQVHRAGPGGIIWAPRDVPHTFTVDSPSARWLVVATPSGFEEFVTRLGQVTDPDPETVAAVAAEFGIEVLGPPGAVPA
jgi:quercetin dioxygenase-like cupin family protein